MAARNNLGQFIREVEMAGSLTVQDMVEEGAKLSRHLAPVGPKHDLRSIPLRESIFHHMFNRTQGMWGASARHALYVEKGTRAHTMTGSPFFRFFWENAGRMWVPGLMGTPDIINHPGTEAQPYLEPALHIILSKWREIARRRYPY